MMEPMPATADIAELINTRTLHQHGDRSIASLTAHADQLAEIQAGPDADDDTAEELRLVRLLINNLKEQQ